MVLWLPDYPHYLNHLTYYGLEFQFLWYGICPLHSKTFLILLRYFSATFHVCLWYLYSKKYMCNFNLSFSYIKKLHYILQFHSISSSKLNMNFPTITICLVIIGLYNWYVTTSRIDWYTAIVEISLHEILWIDSLFGHRSSSPGSRRHHRHCHRRICIVSHHYNSYHLPCQTIQKKWWGRIEEQTR